MDTKRLLNDSRLCRAVTGMNEQELRALEPAFTQALRTHQRQRKPDRQRALGAGQKGHLPTVRQKLLFILVYLKAYPTYDLQGWLFDLERSRACRWVRFLMPVLSTALGRECVLPKRQIRSAEEFFQAFPGARDVFLDGTERPRQKPRSPNARRKTYSGKKKQTTRKVLVLCDEQRRIGWLSPSRSGRRHDKRLWDKTQTLPHLPPDVTVWTDTGFNGMERQHPNVQRPVKASRHHPLTEDQRQNDRLISGLRMTVEHAIGGMKRLGCMSQVYRNRRPWVDDQFALLSAGLWNFHLRQATA